MISQVDTDQIKTIAADVQSLAGDLEGEINALFRRFANVPTVTKEWIGGKSEYYFSRVGLDKQKYLNLAESLRELGQELNSEASSIESHIKSNNGRD